MSRHPHRNSDPDAYSSSSYYITANELPWEAREYGEALRASLSKLNAELCDYEREIEESTRFVKNCDGHVTFDMSGFDRIPELLRRMEEVAQRIAAVDKEVKKIDRNMNRLNSETYPHFDSAFRPTVKAPTLSVFEEAWKDYGAETSPTGSYSASYYSMPRRPEAAYFHDTYYRRNSSSNSSYNYSTTSASSNPLPPRPSYSYYSTDSNFHHAAAQTHKSFEDRQQKAYKRRTTSSNPYSEPYFRPFTTTGPQARTRRPPPEHTTQTQIPTSARPPSDEPIPVPSPAILRRGACIKSQCNVCFANKSRCIHICDKLNLCQCGLEKFFSGLAESAFKETIKKWRVAYHPDKHIQSGNEEQKQMAEEIFKELGRIKDKRETLKKKKNQAW